MGHTVIQKNGYRSVSKNDTTVSQCAELRERRLGDSRAYLERGSVVITHVLKTKARTKGEEV